MFRLFIFNKINLRQTLGDRSSSKRVCARACKIREKYHRLYYYYYYYYYYCYYYYYYYYYYIDNNSAGRMFNFVNGYPVNKKNTAGITEAKYSLFFT